MWSAGFWVVFFVPFSKEVLFICASPPKKKKKNPTGVCRWKPCRPSATKLDLGVPTGLSIKYLLCFGKGEKKQREVRTNHNGREGSNWEVPGGGAGVVQWSDGTQTTVLLVTASLVRKKEPPLNGAPPFSSSLRERERDKHTHANTHAHSRTHFLFLTLSSSRNSRFEEEILAASQVCLYCDAIKLLSTN